MPLRRILLPLLALFVLALLPARAETVRVYTNASFAPLVIDQHHGAYPDVVGYLNSQGWPDLHFELEYIPRKRLQVMLDSGQLDGIVIGFMPQWVGDAAQEKFLWTEPFLADRFVLASPADRPVEFADVAANAGARIGVTLGYVYPVVDDWIAARGLLRSDAPTEAKNLDKLALGRIDMAVVSASVLHTYLADHRPIALHVSELPGPRTERRILVPLARQVLFQRIASAIRALNATYGWRLARERYE